MIFRAKEEQQYRDEYEFIINHDMRRTHTLIDKLDPLPPFKGPKLSCWQKFWIGKIPEETDIVIDLSEDLEQQIPPSP